MHDELVPSRYALKVGDIDVLVISDGVLSLPTQILTANADPAERQAVLDGLLLPKDMLDWPLNVVVVRSGGRTILVDAGVGGTRPCRRPGIWAIAWRPPASILRTSPTWC